MTACYLAAVGDVNDVRTWSGIPFHLLQEGRRQGIINEGLALGTDGLRWTIGRYLWNLMSVSRRRGRGGFQYSTSFLESLWKPVLSKVAGQRILNCFQLYPPSLVDGSSDRWYFLDQTLLQLLDTYGVRREIGSWIAADALDRERQGYERASRIVMHSQWARQSVIQEYNIEPEKVSVVVPGANLDPTAYQRWSARREDKHSDPASPVRLVFVGKDPQRKGLDRLLRAFQIVRSQGAKCTLRIIGCHRESLSPELRAIDGVEWFGFIDKRHDAERYLDAVGSCDIGCLVSRSEAGGIGLREYHALGLAVIGPQVGGSPDHVLKDAARMILPEASDHEIAETIMVLVRDRELLRHMKVTSWECRDQVSWGASVHRLNELMRDSS